MRRQLGEDVREDVRALPARKVAAAMSDERLSQALHSARKSSTRLPAAAAEGKATASAIRALSQLDVVGTSDHVGELMYDFHLHGALGGREHVHGDVQ